MLRSQQKFLLLLVVGILILLSVLLLDGGSETIVVRKLKNKTAQKSNKNFMKLPDPKQKYFISPGVFCQHKTKEFRMGVRLENYWVLYNYFQANLDFKCNETITYTTHGDFTFFDNLEPLLQRWKGPLSLAVYAPGSDFDKTIRAMQFYRECTGSTLVKDYVSVHIYFPLGDFPHKVPTQKSINEMPVDCSIVPEYDESFMTYRKERDMVYPVNVARNVARETAQTYFVFPSDIELYPSPGLIPNFLKMIANDSSYKGSRRVFVSSIFEIEKDQQLPNTKNEVIELLKNKTMIFFHAKICPSCHKVPFQKEWLTSEIMDGMNTTAMAKRHGEFNHWEPIYIGTNNEPWYDERLSWEGRSDKMTQAYKLCLLDYEFHILDNSFLIHRPGIKLFNDIKHLVENKRVASQNFFLRNTVVPEVNKEYGTRTECKMFR